MDAKMMPKRSNMLADKISSPVITEKYTKRNTDFPPDVDFVVTVLEPQQAPPLEAKGIFLSLDLV